MDIHRVLKKYQKIEIELLLSHVLQEAKEFLFMNPDFTLTSKHLNILTKYIRRRKKGEPVAYILGYKDFYGCRFKVNKNVLIPRPETERLVELLIGSLAEKSRRSRYNKIRILDVGTGSGCIIVSLAKLLRTKRKGQSFEFIGSDILRKALEVAKENAKNCKVKIKFTKSDLLKNIKVNFNVIVANLPYVPISDYRQLKKSLQYEPSQAIFAKNRGLALIEKLLKQISELKKQPQAVFLEFDPRQKVILKKLISEHFPKAQVKFYKDLSKFWRYAVISTK